MILYVCMYVCYAHCNQNQRYIGFHWEVARLTFAAGNNLFLFLLLRTALKGVYKQ